MRWTRSLCHHAQALAAQRAPQPGRPGVLEGGRAVVLRVAGGRHQRRSLHDCIACLQRRLVTTVWATEYWRSVSGGRPSVTTTLAATCRGVPDMAMPRNSHINGLKVSLLLCPFSGRVGVLAQR